MKNRWLAVLLTLLLAVSICFTACAKDGTSVDSGEQSDNESESVYDSESEGGTESESGNRTEDGAYVWGSVGKVNR